MSVRQLAVDQNKIPEILSRLDKIFKKDGIIIPVDTLVVKKVDVTELRLYCHFNGIYQIITTELVKWFKENVELSNAIEIGSGVGTLGRALGIKMTDNWQQNKLETKLIYQLSGQPTIKYSNDVEEIDAISAVKKYKPKIVIGSWITHIYNQNQHSLGGNAIGVDELELIKLVDTYYLIGNLNIHSNNRLFKNENAYCTMYHEPFLFSRNTEKLKNFIFKFQDVNII